MTKPQFDYTSRINPFRAYAHNSCPDGFIKNYKSHYDYRYVGWPVLTDAQREALLPCTEAEAEPKGKLALKPTGGYSIRRYMTIQGQTYFRTYTSADEEVDHIREEIKEKRQK
jgi:hypothetical protein